jgi:hypothetical protein
VKPVGCKINCIWLVQAPLNLEQPELIELVNCPVLCCMIAVGATMGEHG